MTYSLQCKEAVTSTNDVNDIVVIEHCLLVLIIKSLSLVKLDVCGCLVQTSTLVPQDVLLQEWQQLILCGIR